MREAHPHHDLWYPLQWLGCCCPKGIRSCMRLLFAVFLASLCALLWAAFSVATHIRRQEKVRDGEPGTGESVTDAAAKTPSARSLREQSLAAAALKADGEPAHSTKVKPK